MLGPLPNRGYEPQKYSHNPTPLRPDEVVTDHTLRLFTPLKPEYQTGTITTEDQAILANILPDVFAELLAYRIAARKAGAS